MKRRFDEEHEDPGERRSSDLHPEPSPSLAACNASHGKRKRKVGGGGGGVSPANVNPFPMCRTHDKSKERKEMATRIRVYLLIGFWGADWRRSYRASSLVGRRASVDHAVDTLGVLLKSKICWSRVS